MNATLCGAITFVGCLIAFTRGLLFAVADSQFDMLIYIIMHLNIFLPMSKNRAFCDPSTLFILLLFTSWKTFTVGKRNKFSRNKF